MTYYMPSELERARLLLMLTPEGCEYAKLAAQWGPQEPAYQLRLIFSHLLGRRLAMWGPGFPAAYCLRVSPEVQSALAAARALVEGEQIHSVTDSDFMTDGVANCHNMPGGADTVASCNSVPDLTPALARVLLLVSLEPQTVAAIADRLAERGHLLTATGAKKHLDKLAALELVEVQRGKSRQGNRYHLGSGPAVETALDRAYALAGATETP